MSSCSWFSLRFLRASVREGERNSHRCNMDSEVLPAHQTCAASVGQITFSTSVYVCLHCPTDCRSKGLCSEATMKRIKVHVCLYAHKRKTKKINVLHVND